MSSLSLNVTVLLAVCVSFCMVHQAESWRGHVCRVSYWQYYRYRYCACWYWWWGCSYYRYRWTRRWVTYQRCCSGWTHPGNQDCNTAICYPRCQNNGVCYEPNRCNCTSIAVGSRCENRVCSYIDPCYPGTCLDGTTQCSCEDGFGGNRGCLDFQNSGNRDMEPYISLSRVTLSQIRRFDGVMKYNFTLDATNYTEIQSFWTNQRDFNDLKFEFDSEFLTPEGLSARPIYVHSAEFGIVANDVHATVSSIPRAGTGLRYISFNNTYNCNNGVSDLNPRETLTCTIQEENFKTLMEHGDWLTVVFRAENGGFRTLVNIDSGGTQTQQAYNGLEVEKTVRFMFDFDAPKHCMERDPSENKPQFASCPNPPAQPLLISEEFTKNPIVISWGDWTDELSGLWEHYVEVFELIPNIHKNLTEKNPIRPTHTALQSAGNNSLQYTPTFSGMFSVLMETRDWANNSKVARRLVLYDPDSNITLNQADDSRMFVSTAVAETGYMWQTASNPDSTDMVNRVTVTWANHFRNSFHEDNYLLNPVNEYPIQFQEIQEDGILSASKYVFTGMDDLEGERTLRGINNFHGIVKFETFKAFDESTAEPTDGWEEITPLAESYTFDAEISDGAHVRIWTRATDIMGNTAVDNTLVRFDTTPPIITNSSNSRPEKTENVPNGRFNYTTRIEFDAADQNSGVHKIGYKIYIIKQDDPTSRDTVYTSGEVPANFQPYDPTAQDASCQRVDNHCFYTRQKLDLDNCYFIVDKEMLDTSSAIVEVSVFNQALLTTSFQMEIDHINRLSGLEKYSGPTNIRVISKTPNGVRLGWKLPEKASCYGRAEIVLILFHPSRNSTTVHVLNPSTEYFDILNLDQGSDYEVKLGLQLNDDVGGTIAYQFQTDTAEEPTSPIGAIVGATVAVVAIVVLAVVIMIVLMRRGHLQPMRKRLDALSVRYRNRKSLFSDNAYDNKVMKPQVRASSADDMYIYGGMDFDSAQSWHLSRSDVSFESLLKSGHFANIYKARVRTSTGRQQAVAKTLKEGFTEDDRILMMAKINFSGTQMLQHHNVIGFLGAVVEDTGVGPFSVYELCENGNLKDYLTARKEQVTVELQENLFRFGLDIAKGMEYLISKGVIHRRLAARNILLTFLNEVKIAGFGPLPVEQSADGDAESGKKERIPVKWMPPECMDSTKDANEKSDIWSYGVVLWEIFSLGEQPYGNIRSRELPSHLKKGGRLPKPEQCDDTWYGVMQRTWSFKQSKRPTFKEIREELDTMFVQSPGDENYYYSRN